MPKIASRKEVEAALAQAELATQGRAHSMRDLRKQMQQEEAAREFEDEITPVHGLPIPRQRPAHR